MITNVYVDGLNLYYRALKDSPFKWLNLLLLAQILFPADTIQSICYFTALVHPQPNDPSQRQRQQIYLRALSTLSGFEAIYGNIRARTKTRPLVQPIAGLPNYVQIRDFEEKGTDVNLATRLLTDGFSKHFEQAIVVTNDSDLASPIKYIRDDLQLDITVLNPDYNSRAHPDLVKAASYIKNLRRNDLRRSQFSTTLQDAQGAISKPAVWP